MKIFKAFTNITVNTLDGLDKVIANVMSTAIDVTEMSASASKSMLKEQKLEQEIDFSKLATKHKKELALFEASETK